MQYCFAGKTSDAVWRKAMKGLLSGNPNCQDSRLGKVLELPHVSFSIGDSRQRWVTSRRPFMNPAFAIAEVFAILGGSNDAKFLNFWNPALPKYAGNASEYYGAYGYRLRSKFKFDQIDRGFEVLKNNPESRQVVLQIWDPLSDLPNANGSPKSEDIPCNICSMLKVRDGKLDWLQVMRSNDIYRGTPYNFVQFTMLQEVMAGWLGLDLGNYCQISDSLHVYEDDLSEIDFNVAGKSNSRLKNKDDLRLGRKDWEQVFAEVFYDMKCLSSSDLTKSKFNDIFRKNNIPAGYRNLLLVAAADCARRHGWFEEVDYAMDACVNELLIYLWSGWEKRMVSTLK